MTSAASPGRRGLVRFAWATIALNVVVIVLGGFVRATGSGAGCGRSWPTCAGEVVPTELVGARAIEFTHRAVSGIALLAVFALALWAWRAFPPGHRARRAAAWSAGLIVAEALIGAGIVLFEWVAHDASVARAVSVPLHLVNTLALLAALTLTAWWVGGAPPMRARGVPVARWLFAAAAGMVAVAATGAVTALAATLFPSASLAEGFAADFDAASHFLTRLRIIHPVVAVAVGALTVWIAVRHGRRERARPIADAVVALVGLQVVAGVGNVLLLDPIWLQMVHLLLADLLWIAFVLLGASLLADPRSLSAQAVSPQASGSQASSASATA